MSEEMAFACLKKEACRQCGRCCHIRDAQIMDEEEDLKLRERLYEKVGILYLYPFHRYTISLTQKEKEILEKEAERREITLKVIPKKIRIIEGQYHVMDWSLDHDICPFFDKTTKHCTIYALRPEVCRVFPKEFRFEVPPFSDLLPRRPFVDAMKSGLESFRKAMD
ncbi:MAG: YkgJ family cysteine cluster protein [Nanoarchaeota archaeon]